MIDRFATLSDFARCSVGLVRFSTFVYVLFVGRRVMVVH